MVQAGLGICPEVLNLLFLVFVSSSVVLQMLVTGYRERRNEERGEDQDAKANMATVGISPVSSPVSLCLSSSPPLSAVVFLLQTAPPLCAANHNDKLSGLLLKIQHRSIKK